MSADLEDLSLFDPATIGSAAEPTVPNAELTPDPPRDEIERLDPTPTPMVLESGLEFEIEPLKLRQFLRLLRIISRGSADLLDTINLNFNDQQAFIQTFMALVLFSVPEAEDETIDFLKSVVKPVGLVGNTEKDLPKFAELNAQLDNPELDDTLTILQVLIEHESEDLRALGKRLMKMFAVAQKMGAVDIPTSGTA